MLRRSLVLSFLFCFSALVHSQKYRVEDVVLVSKDKTKTPYLMDKIPSIDKTTLFETKDDILSYLEDIDQSLENTRLLENLTYSYEELQEQDGIIPVRATYTFNDSTSLLIFPKPSFDSNKGAELEIALRDNNFLGFTNSLGAGITFSFGDKEEPERFSKFTPGFNLDYILPFKIGRTTNQWSNVLDFRWCVEKSLPYFFYTTGLTFTVPFGNNDKHHVEFTVQQSINRNYDYIKYDDALHYTEYGEIAIPFNICNIDLSTPVYYRPTISLKHNWDADGINERNVDLKQSPLLRPGQELYFERIDWIGKNNFRDGFSVKVGTYIGFDLHTKNPNNLLAPALEINIKHYKAFDYAGINVNFNGLFGQNTRYPIGALIRGGTDNSLFTGDIYVDDNNYAFTTSSALVWNIDFPIHLFTTDWVSFFHAKDTCMEKLFTMANFELQFSPFIDIGLLDNKGTKNHFSIYEGIYTSGFELLIYPCKWKSFVVRGSLGFDLSKILLDGHGNFDSSWRDSKDWECYFGLGLLF